MQQCGSFWCFSFCTATNTTTCLYDSHTVGFSISVGFVEVEKVQSINRILLCVASLTNFHVHCVCVVVVFLSPPFQLTEQENTLDITLTLSFTHFTIMRGCLAEEPAQILS